MKIENISEERKKMILEAVRGMDERMTAIDEKNPEAKAKYRLEEIKPPADLQKFDENYIIELFTITETQDAEIKALKTTVSKQQTVIDNLKEKLKVIGEVAQTATEEKVVIKKEKTTKKITKAESLITA